MKVSRIQLNALRAVSFVAGLLAASTEGVAYDDWVRHFRLGTWVGFNIGADFSVSGTVPLGAAQPGVAGIGGVDRTYDDGYVRVDETGNAQGVTSYWGYQDASQLSGSTLIYRASKSFTTADSVSKDGGPQFGLDMAYGWNLRQWGTSRLGVEFGFGLLPVDLKDSRALSGVFERSVHAFDTGGILVPQAPYSGGSSGIGPTIRDIPTALPDETTPGQLTGFRQIDAWLYNLRLGPQYYQDIGQKWGFSASGGFATGIVAGDYVFDETVFVGGASGVRNVGRIGKTDFVFGAYANTLLYYHLTDQADIYAGVQWMMLGDTRFSNANREAVLKMGSGFQVLVGINWPL